MTDVDVVVIGAGPSGSYTASLLAQKGLRVLVCEKNQEAGEGVNCSGIIGREAFTRLDLPQDAILSALHSIRVFSPGGHVFSYAPPSTIAYVVDRKRFDSGLANQACVHGAVYRFSCHVNDLRVTEKEVLVRAETEGRSEEFRAQVCVIANGFKSTLAQKVGLDGIRETLQGIQMETEVTGVSDTEVHLGQEIAPGSFAWVVPLGDGRARIGLTTSRQSYAYFRRFLQLLSRQGKRIRDEAPIRCSLLPMGGASRSVAPRILVVGEAAGQVKTSTQGGIYYGLLAAEIAARTIETAFTQGDFSLRALHPYETDWWRLLGLELTMGRYLRAIYRRLPDPSIDLLVKLAGHTEITHLILDWADFDWHTPLISRLVRLSGVRFLLMTLRGGPADKVP